MIYLSFADPTRPTGTQFLGAALVRADGFGAAILRAHALGINPGGEVLGGQLPDWALAHVDDAQVERLMLREEAQAFNDKMDEIAGTRAA